MLWTRSIHRVPPFILVLAFAIGMSAVACAERSIPEPVAVPSNAECAVTSTYQRVSPKVSVEYAVGGQLAGTLRSVIASSYYKSQWAVRGAAPQARMTLVARQLASGETVEFAADPITGDDPTGLSDWGPTYYTQVFFPSIGCWRISTVGGNPTDAITIWVARGSP
jgi:hypothetical protein